MGVKQEGLVSICIERSLKIKVGILGVLKAGGAYVLLNPAYPQERIVHMFYARPMYFATSRFVLEELAAKIMQDTALSEEAEDMEEIAL